MDPYRQKVATSGSWSRKERKAMKARARSRLAKDDRSEEHEFFTEWSEEDREWAGLCSRYPSLSWLAKTRKAALEGIKKLVAGIR